MSQSCVTSMFVCTVFSQKIINKSVIPDIGIQPPWHYHGSIGEMKAYNSRYQ